MKHLLTQWNALVAKCTPATKFSAPHTLRTASVNTGGISCVGINLSFDEDVSIRYQAYLVIDKDGDLAIEYAYYTAETGIKYLDKKRVKLEVGSESIDVLDVDTGPLRRSLCALKKYNPAVSVDLALDVLRRQIRHVLCQIEVSAGADT